MKVCRNNLYLNCTLSVILLIINILPYWLPWFFEESLVLDSNETGSFKRLHFSLFQVWVPQVFEDPDHVLMPLSDFISAGCPTVDKSNQLCSSFHHCQFATLGYLPLKIISQLVHALNLFNAVRVIRTDLKRNRLVWLQQTQD